MQKKLRQLVRHSAGNQFSQVKNVCNIYYKLADFIRDLIMQYLVTFMSVISLNIRCKIDFRIVFAYKCVLAACVNTITLQ